MMIEQSRALMHTNQERLLGLEKRLIKPFSIIGSEKERGFRYGKPGPIHYVVLNIARSVSLWNAMHVLNVNSYSLETEILARSFIENQSKLQYVNAGIGRNGVDKKSQRFLQEFFADNDRSTESRARYKPISQKDLNRRNSEAMSRDIDQLRKFGITGTPDNNDDQFAHIISDLFNKFSNRVHGRYPEMMDIYGQKTTTLRVSGNDEFYDDDIALMNELMYRFAKDIQRQLRVSMFNLMSANLLKLDQTEKNFCVERAF